MMRKVLPRRFFLTALLLLVAVEPSVAQLFKATPRSASTHNRVVTGAAPAGQNHPEMRRMFRKDGAQHLPGEHAVAGHRIESGEGMVLSYSKRIYFAETGIKDDNVIFEKLTVFLPTPLAGDYGIVDLSEQPKIIVFWSRGAANFSANKVCAGYAEDGEIEFRRRRGQLQAKFDFRIRPIGVEQFDRRACKPFRFLHVSWFEPSSEIND